MNLYFIFRIYSFNYILLPLFFYYSKEEESNFGNLISQITITTNQETTQYILSSSYNLEVVPDKIIINGEVYNYTNIFISNLASQNHNITIIWINKIITSCKNMFRDLSNIIKIDLSKFDSSLVTDMSYMFYNCLSLISLDLTNFNTSSAINMAYMFYQCNLLASLDLESFNTSSVINMEYMFRYCNSLIILDLNSFNTSLVESMKGMFEGCNNLVSLNLNNFYTPLVININHIFADSYSLQYVNLNNFITSSVSESICHIFNYMSNLRYCLRYCLNAIEAKLLNDYILELDAPILDCNNICFTHSKYKYEYKNKCYDSCPKRTNVLQQNSFLCEDLNCSLYYNYDETECLDNIPEGFYLNNNELKTIEKCDIKCSNCSLESISNNSCIQCNINKGFFPKYEDLMMNKNNPNSFINCYSELPEGYFFDEINKNYHKCNEKCKKCTEFGNNNNNNKCIECFPEFILINNNCYEKCVFYYYFNLSNLYECTPNKKCVKEYSKLIEESGECVKNCIYDYKYEYNNKCYKSCPNDTHETFEGSYLCEKECPSNLPYENTENNQCVENCDSSQLFTEECKIKNNNSSLKDNILLKIQNDLLNGTLDSLILNLLEGDKEDLNVESDNVIYQITSSDNQNKKNYINISTIKLSKCENILRDSYHMSKNESLIILKIDIYEPGILTPIVEYEVYSKSKVKLNLSICNKTEIEIILPSKDVDEKNLFKYDSSNDYYNDICYTYTTDSGTDITLKDRKKEYINKNFSLCEDNCVYEDFINETKSVKCKCGVKINLPLISQISFNKDKLLSNIENMKNLINLKIMKCYKVLFNKNGFKYNIGCLILLIIILITIINCFIFIIKEKKILNDKIDKLSSINENIKKKKKDIIIINKKGRRKNKNDKKKQKNKKDLNMKNNTKKENTKTYKNKLKNNPPKIKNNNYKSKKKNINTLKTSGEDLVGKSSSIRNIGDNKNLKYINEKKSTQNNNKNISNKIVKNKYNDYELNTLIYKDALYIDKRNYIKYYLSLLKRKQLVIFCFYTSNDYNAKTIKISLFFFYFALSYTVNALFFNEETIHQIYITHGKFDLNYQIPFILFSTLITSVVNIIINTFSLSEKNILELKKFLNNPDIKQKAINLKKFLTQKFIIFYILIFLLLFFSWFYLSCFCIIYKNTQIFLIKDTLFSYFLSLLYPFVFCLIPGIFRIPALKAKQRNKETMYKFSKIIQIM